MSTMSTPVIQPAPDVRERLNLNPSHWSVRVLAEIGVAVALAAVLGQLRLFQMPQGGSVSLEMLPIIFIAIRGGVMPAFVTGLLYGLLQLILPGAFIYHPAQAALDYPLAFSALAVAGFVPVRALVSSGAGRVGHAGLRVSKRLPQGVGMLFFAVMLGVGARFIFHFLSGLIFFAAYAPGWEAPWLYSMTYNLLYLVPEALISAVVLIPLLVAYDAAFPGGMRGGRDA
jgi:thiamine transporter